MKEIIMNDNNLEEKDIEIKKEKVRAILIENNNLLIAHYGDISLLPGGSIDENENEKTAILRELKEETGIIYLEDELEESIKLTFYQKEYPLRKVGIVNRKLTTTFYIGKYKGIDLEKTKITSSEKEGNFKLELITFDKLNEIIDSIDGSNNKDKYFKRELEEVRRVILNT